MESFGQDWSFWRWLASALVSAVCGLVGAVWWTRGLVDKVDELDRSAAKKAHVELEAAKETADMESIKLRVAIIEGRCDRQKQEIIDMIRSEVRSEIRIAIAEHSGRIGDRLGEITATLAGMAAHLEEARDDIVSLFDRRHINCPGAPHRRTTDLDDGN